MSDLIGIVEAVYRRGLSQQGWLRGLAEAARPVLDDGFGVAAFYVDFAQERPIQQLLSAGMASPSLDILVWTALDGDKAVLRACHERPVTTLQRALGPRYQPGGRLRMVLEAEGVYDLVFVTALAADGSGVGLVAPCAATPMLARPTSSRLSRVAEHLACGLRLRAMTPWELLDALPDALFEANTDPRAPEQRERLRHAASAVERARSQCDSADAEAARNAWQSLIHGTLVQVDGFDFDGRRYVLAAANPAAGTRGAGLTPRQCRILTLRSAGQSLKRIADDVDCSISTVSLDLQRALKVLGLRSVHDLAVGAPA